jgi:hypothetical protein
VSVLVVVVVVLSLVFIFFLAALVFGAAPSFVLLSKPVQHGFW